MVAGERQLSRSTQGQAANLLNAGAQSTLSFLFSLGPQGMLLLPMLRVAPPPLINLTWIQPHGHAQGFVSKAIGDLAKLRL